MARGPVGGAGRDANKHKRRREQFKKQQEGQQGLNQSAAQGHEEARNPQPDPKGVPDPDMRRMMLGRPSRGLRDGTIAIGIHTMGADPQPNFVKQGGMTMFAAPNGRTYTWSTKHPSHPASADDAFDQLSELGERLY